jgi:hypothetical protein
VCRRAVQGRLLLTDADGLYNSFLAEACRVTLGNAVILVTSDDVDESEYMDRAIVQELLECGQTSVEQLHNQKRQAYVPLPDILV